MWLCALLFLLLLAQAAHADVLCGGCAGKGQGYYAPPGCDVCACCAPCPPGAWCRNADPTGNLTECAVGRANPATGQRQASACAQCPANSIAPAAGLANCSACAPPLYSLPGTGACCPAGALSVAGSTECAACSAGSSCPAGVEVPCALGSFSAAAGAVACAACAPGRFSPSLGATACQPCPEDHVSGSGASACTLCAAVRGGVLAASGCASQRAPSWLFPNPTALPTPLPPYP